MERHAVVLTEAGPDMPFVGNDASLGGATATCGVASQGGATGTGGTTSTAGVSGTGGAGNCGTAPAPLGLVRTYLLSRESTDFNFNLPSRSP